MIGRRQNVTLTENQLKVIKDKYMKDSPSVEAWLDLVASNIALAELLYVPNKEGKIFEGVDYAIEEFATTPGTRITLLHHGKSSMDAREKNFRVFMNNLYRLATEDEACVAAYEPVRERFYTMLARWEFLPNSPTLMNAGRDLQQLSACYVLPIEDSIEGWMDAAKNAAIIHKSGGGTGFSVCRVRPRGSMVRSTKGVASGALSPLMIINSMTDEVKQGGQRRGANMGIMPYWHPDVLDFCKIKKEEGKLQNFNISVAIDKRFMEAMERGEDFELINPHTKETVGKLNARQLWEELVQGAWETGDPGIIILDRINETDSNTTPHIGMIEATNPCGEQPLLPYEPCNLGSINLSKFVNGNDMDWERLRECVRTAVHFLDNVIDVNNYPLPEIERMAKGNRRIGLGVMGWAETLVLLGLPYNSEDARKKAEEVMRFINEQALEMSEELARTRGVFPFWKGSVYDAESPHFRGRELHPRHCARTTIAPTGTIGITAGLQGAGIEPFFAIVYVRYNARALDAVRAGKKPEDKDVFYEINPLFKKIAEDHAYFGLEPEELWNKVEKNHKSLVGIAEIPERIQRLFLTAHDLTPEEHVRMQASFQRYTDNAVSKTINFPNSATPADVSRAYRLAYELGCKGITIYRDGSKSVQVLNLSEKKLEKEEKQKPQRKKAYQEQSIYYKIDTAYGPLHIHINYDEVGPTKLFANISPSGTEISGLTTAVAILLSKYFELGGDPVKILRHLNSIKGDRPYGFGPNRVDSIPHALAKALRDYLVKSGKPIGPAGQMGLSEKAFSEQSVPKIELSKMPVVREQQEETQTSLPAATPAQYQRDGGLYCPRCFSNNVAMLSGCSGPTCFDCNFAECG